MNSLPPHPIDPLDVIREEIQIYADKRRPCIPTLSTLQFLKAKILPGRQMVYITFLANTGERWYFTYFLRQLTSGKWYISSGSGGRRDTYRPLHNGWLHLRSALRADEFFAGGEVVNHVEEIVRVQLVTRDGHVLEDSVQDGLVLFWSNQKVSFPIHAECYNQAGELIHREKVLDIPRKLLETEIGSHFRTFVQEE